MLDNGMPETRGGWNKGRAHNLVYISRQLRAGKHPVDLGAKEIGQGAQKTAYAIEIREPNNPKLASQIVIKTEVVGWNGQKTPPKLELAKYGARVAKTQRAGLYRIQEMVTPIMDANGWMQTNDMSIIERAKGLGAIDGYDMHFRNVGFTPTGELVVFDW